MSFQLVYDECQKFPVRLDRNILTTLVTDVVGKGPIKVVRSGLDTSHCRGFYFCANNRNHPIPALLSTNVIVLARSLNRCWERFVYVKELMHHLDSASESTDSGDQFELMLAELIAGMGPKSAQTISEISCFWKALSLFCPEQKRLELEVARKEKRLDDYDIALQLRMPEAYVPYLFNGRYATILPLLFS